MEATDSPEERRISHRNITDGEKTPEVALVETIADLKETDQEELTQLYACIDDVIGHLYESQLAAAANAELTFTYEGYRITLYQDGRAVFQEL